LKQNRGIAFIGLIFLVITTSVTTLLGAGILLTGGNIFSITSTEDISFIGKILATKRIMQQEGYTDVKNEDILDAALKGMASAVGDKYTEYLSGDENEELEIELGKEYAGIGIYIMLNPYNNEITVVSVIKDSPAERAGVERLDKILEINGERMTPEDFTRAADLLKGEAGTEVKLLIESASGATKNITLKRENIIIKSVNHEKKDAFGYIEINSFGTDTAKEFDKAYEDLANQGIKGLIIDLRDNGGGIYDEVIHIANRILPKGSLIVYTEDKNANQEREYSSNGDITMPVVVLINENSASASEILAGAIKDNKRGTLVGEKTYGKGLVQGLYSLKDGSSIKVTIAKYFTPSGICIEGIGIKPDIEIEQKYGAEDRQLNKAIEILKTK